MAGKKEVKKNDLFQTRLNLEVYRANDTEIDSVILKLGEQEQLVFANLPPKVRKAIKKLMECLDPGTPNNFIE